MATETEDSLARLVDRQIKTIKKLQEKNAELLEVLHGIAEETNVLSAQLVARAAIIRAEK